MYNFPDAINSDLGLIQTVVALSIYTIVTSITPGPNNMMVLASGVNFGVRRTVPHVLGISLGFAAMVVVVGMGLGAVFDVYPMLNAVLRWVGAAYLVYLAYKIARSGTPDSSDSKTGNPLGFLGAAAFQWVNPKAWVMALGAVAAYLPQHPSLVSVLAMATLMALLNAPCVGVWATFGVGLRSFLTKPSQLKFFNISMATLLVASLYPIVARS
jgi:threonine/homoserine/homoserine lactone efflux protein